MSDPRDEAESRVESHESRAVLEARSEWRIESRVSGEMYASASASICPSKPAESGRRSGESTGASSVYLASKLDTSSCGLSVARLGMNGASSLHARRRAKERLRKNGCACSAEKSDVKAAQLGVTARRLLHYTCEQKPAST